MEQEPRSRRLSIAVTDREYRAARIEAAYRGVSISELVRTANLADIVADYENREAA